MPAAKTEGSKSDEILRPSELQAISAQAITRSFPRNTVVVHEGDRTDSLYIIVSGRVKIYVSDETGKEIVLNHAGPGEYFGEMTLDGGPRSASVMTLEPTRFSVVPKEDFHSFVARSPEFSLHLIRKLIRRVRALTGDVKSLALMDVYGRVARTLLELAEERDGLLVIEARPTHQDIASRVGASREMVSRILKDLTEGGYAVIEGRRMTILRKLPQAW